MKVCLQGQTHIVHSQTCTSLFLFFIFIVGKIRKNTKYTNMEKYINKIHHSTSLYNTVKMDKSSLYLSNKQILTVVYTQYSQRNKVAQFKRDIPVTAKMKCYSVIYRSIYTPQASIKHAMAADALTSAEEVERGQWTEHGNFNLLQSLFLKI